MKAPKLKGRHLLLVIAGLVLVYCLRWGMHEFSKMFRSPQDIQPILLQIYEAFPFILGVGLLIALGVVNAKVRVVASSVAAGGVCGYALFTLSLAANLQPFFVGPIDQARLNVAEAGAADGSGSTISDYSRLNADVLNSAESARQLGLRRTNQRLIYIPPGVPSTGPTEISVNPIDRDHWAAVALSVSGDCIAKLVIANPNDHAKGDVVNGQLKPGVPCMGSLVTSDLSNWR